MQKSFNVPKGYVPTMTINELVTELRNHGIKTSPARVGAAIEQGKYPFAISVRLEERAYEIYAKKFYEWLDDVSV